MPRRFAFALLTLLLLLLATLLVGRKLTARRRPNGPSAAPTARPTPAVPPTPIPARRVELYFESGEDGRLHPEARDVSASLDDVGFLRSIAAGVLAGPRRAELQRAFPEGWSLRGAYRMKNGLVVLDLQPPAPPPADEGAPAPSAKWETGTHEEETAIQALVVSLARNVPDVTRVVLLLAGEPAETLAGHLDLSHPIHPDLARAADEPPLEPPTPTPLPAAPSLAAGTPPVAAPTAAPVATPPGARPPSRTPMKRGAESA